MQLIIAAVGHKMPAWITTGFEEYVKRMPPDCRIVLKEVKPQDRTGNMSAGAAMQIEKTRIEAVLPKGARIVALDERGQDPSSVQLSQHLQKWRGEGRDVAFIIGGADGLDPELKNRRPIDAPLQPDPAARHGPGIAGRATVSRLVDYPEPSLPPGIA